MEYPKRIVKKGEPEQALVKAIQAQLNEQNCGPLEVDGHFGDQTSSAVKLFQTRHMDAAGSPLKADGQIGALTWAALFGGDTLQNTHSSSNILKKAVEIAASQIGVVEQPPLSNRGPQVDEYLKSVGLNPAGHHYSWCAAFVYWSFQQAAQQLGIINPLYKTAGVLDHWANARCIKILKLTALANPALIIPGSIFIIDHGGGLGHTGMVESVNGGNLTTIEGNTNPGQSREGYGVFRLTRRKIGDISKGFLNYD